ncbi:uncharacterized protein FPRO_11816 [Fusarium proliferatum ET1]|uniref:Uncharacterized protein n=1 Tax=Fusarium proliferatum (strain ET1) TaxID=1227346 RepID=A0A1L7W169_FUSPR|nr:uncharacterized protein FPRO_11816 [Fusarium proliferatum ET1]CZR46368.1 uncharacterized protein FPRO_11816 [Fusarium proliferatum ET1]SCV37480.1 uncharacterized protein FFB14_06633 [Fusarium fujikuroi]
MALLNTSGSNPQGRQVRCGSSSDGGGEEQPGLNCKSKVRSAGMSRGNVKTSGELGLRLGELWAVECGPRDYGSGQQLMSPNESDAASWP